MSASMNVAVFDCATGTAETRPATTDELTNISTVQQAAAAQAVAAAAVAQADSDDRTARQQWLTAVHNDLDTLAADRDALNGTGTLNQTQLRAMLGRADAAIVRIDEGLIVLARILARREL